jgi:glycosyltransferase involved in cell wall biosynthesis
MRKPSSCFYLERPARPGRRPIGEDGLSGTHEAGRRFPRLKPNVYDLDLAAPSRLRLFLQERRLGETLAGTGASFEIIFVDDHSPDGSWTVIEEIAAAGGGRTRGLRLAQNVGQHMAVLTGLSEARGTRCVVLDADLQDPPEAIPDLLGPEFHDYGAVFAGRRGDYAPPGRLFTSALYRRLLSRVSGVPLDAGMFFAIAQEDVRRLLDLRISKASLVAMIGLSGIRSTSLPVRRSVRNSGRSAIRGSCASG